MAVFNCPVCHKNHSIHQGDDMDYECPDNAAGEYKPFQNLTPTDLLTRNAWNFNRFSTKKDLYRNAGIKNPLGSLLKQGTSNRLGGGRAADNW